MTAAEPAHVRTGRLIAMVFTTAVFVNAALLFSVEPMFSKMALPLLGGTAAVWNTCLLFFQTALLAGYVYAHLITSRLTTRRQVTLHLGLLVLAAVALPISVAAGFRSPPGSAPVPWLIGLLTISLGAPFLMLSSGAPLLQRWFSATAHRHAVNPYFLYAASNLGSLIALLAYPVVIERTLSVTTQSRAWAIGYALLIFLVAACSIAVWRTRGGGLLATSDGGPRISLTQRATTAASLTTARRLHWVALSFVPSSMLLGVTTYLSTDIAAIPLLWVVPLAIYLLTFVIAFSTREWFRPPLVLGLQVVFLVWLTLTMAAGFSGLVRVMGPAHLALLFLSALVCHTTLAADKPPATHLTEFYLWISAGGVLGGIFNVLIAPHIFSSVAEYPIAIILAAFVRPELPASDPKRARSLDALVPAMLGIVLMLLLSDGLPISGLTFRTSLAVFVGACAIPSIWFRNRPVRLGLWLAIIFAIGATRLVGPERRLLRTRSFFGVYTVARVDSFRTLQHGTTTHGAQRVGGPRVLEPLTYYHRRSPIAQVLEVIGQSHTNRRVGIVGLGTGSLACYGRPNESWTFYEIDPLVERIARTPSYFTYLRDCPPTTRVIIGDARLELAKAATASYDMLVIDAFASDAIPIHLLTREALEMYLDKLAPGGVIAFHISNRYLDLEPVLAGVARATGSAALVGSDAYIPAAERQPFESLSKWVVIARSDEVIAPLRLLRGWLPVRASDARVWTDDFSNVLSVLRVQ